jgi:hypothetical protein
MKRQKYTKNGHKMSFGAEAIEILKRKSIMDTNKKIWRF